MSTRGCEEEQGLGRDPPPFPALFLLKYFLLKSESFIYCVRVSAAAIKEIADVMEAPGRQAGRQRL